ncbi:hypothetical protein EBO15_38170 [Actinomadura harenae]|uniref:Uncharacterized protein n=1 Tax=Actinomadura harenae TaxID=2483351 RepID=A0A3M2LHM1_9ACTN|nr:hypothetical protein EBO15_38170 [Actinomadura harenae]
MPCSAPPPTWAHAPILVNAKRQKLSKRRDKAAVMAARFGGAPRDHVGRCQPVGVPARLDGSRSGRAAMASRRKVRLE